MHSCRAPLALLLGCTACSALTTASVRACSQPAIQSSRAATSAITADANAALAGGFMLKPLPAAKAMFLLLTWAKTASDQRSAGFQPESEAIGERANKLKEVAKELDRLKALANILALAERGSVSFDKLSEPHASQGEALSRTKVVGAISAGKGSAIAFVSSWDEHVSVDAIIINPAYLIAGEEAELALLDYVVEEARKDGIEDIRLRAPYQVEGRAFYEPCGFFPTSEDAVEDEPLVWRGHALAGALARDETVQENGDEVQADAAGLLPPEGFSWGITV